MSKKVLVLYPKINYLNALKTAHITPCLDINCDCDGLILTGGGDILPSLYNCPNISAHGIDKTRDMLELFYVKKYLCKHKPIFGICRGMQLVNVFFRGKLNQDVKNHSQINGKDRFHLVKNIPNTTIYNIFGEKLQVNSAHHQIVSSFDKQFTVNSIALDGVIECLTYKNILLTQFHPERMGFNGQKLFQYFAKLL